MHIPKIFNRGFYDKLPLEFTSINVTDFYSTDVVVGGKYKDGFVDPLTGKNAISLE